MTKGRSEAPRSLAFAFIAVFAALHASLAALPEPFGFRRPSIFIESLAGVILGPYGGFVSSMIGFLVGRYFRPTEHPLLVIFGLGEVAGTVSAALLFRDKWKIVLVTYLIMLLAYFLHPLGLVLPAWALWDTYLAGILIYPTAWLLSKSVKGKFDARKFSVACGLTIFISLTMDSLTRIFLLIPLNLYQALGLSVEVLVDFWYLGAIQTPLEALTGLIVGLPVMVSVLVYLTRSEKVSWPIT